MINSFRPDGGGPSYFGFYPAIVTDIIDSEGLGRIQVKFPSLGEDGSDVRAWATLITPYADDSQGFQFLPAVGTQVVTCFEAGNPRRPYIVGSCWNGKESLPDEPAVSNNKRLIKTRSGSLLEFDDADGAAKVTISMNSGHQLVFDDGKQEVSLKHSNGCVLKFNGSGGVTITATGSITINAPSGASVNTPSAVFSGNIVCQGLTAISSITSPLYSPGAGNIW